MITAENRKARLFTIRLWQATPEDDPAALEWRGKVQSLPDGEAYYFRDWPGLVRHIETMLSSENEPFPGSDIPDGGES
jgi:hypothetical protein